MHTPQGGDTPTLFPVVAALFVERGGPYWNLPGVDPWDEERDARTYAGPHPVVAHPPCRTWSNMANCRPEIVVGDDDGCFESALRAVRRWGGVLEHPALTKAWRRFDIPRPPAYGWATSVEYYEHLEWVCEVDQGNYGYGCRKPTWLLYVGANPPPMRWGNSGHPLSAANFGGGEKGKKRGSRPKRSATPPEFRDVLLAMARSVSVPSSEVAA